MALPFNTLKPYVLQANLSNPATSLNEVNSRIRQVVKVDRLEKYMAKFNRLGFLARFGQEIGADRCRITKVIVYI